MDFGTWFDNNKTAFYVDGEFDWETFKDCAALNLFAVRLVGISCKNGVTRFRFKCNDVAEFVIFTNPKFCTLG